MHGGPPFQFEIGQIVHHRRYGYRGVVFERDATCQADEAWYQKNMTQPPRNQPWYHVLVDGQCHTTYVAESNLEPAQSKHPVRHPYIDRLFSGFHGGKYWRESQN